MLKSALGVEITIKGNQIILQRDDQMVVVVGTLKLPAQKASKP